MFHFFYFSSPVVCVWSNTVFFVSPYSLPPPLSLSLPFFFYFFNLPSTCLPISTLSFSPPALLFFCLYSMELHKALTLVDPTASPAVTSTSLTQVHPGPGHHHQQHPGNPVPGPLTAIPLQPLTVKAPTAGAAPMTYFSGYNMGLVDPMVSSAAMAAGTMAVNVDRKALTTKLRVGVTAGPIKTAERPKFSPY